MNLERCRRYDVMYEINKWGNGAAGEWRVIEGSFVGEAHYPFLIHFKDGSKAFILADSIDGAATQGRCASGRLGVDRVESLEWMVRGNSGAVYSGPNRTISLTDGKVVEVKGKTGEVCISAGGKSISLTKEDVAKLREAVGGN